MKSWKMLNIETLNESQRRAVTHASGENLLIVAGPGSGKTFTITQRIFYLIQKLHVPPETILVVTFTKDAAVSMHNRFLEQSDFSYPVNFGTFHSIFYNILRQSQRIGQFNILTEKQKKDILLPILKKRLNSAGNNEAYQLLSAFSYYKNTGNQQMTEGRVDSELKPLLKECFEEYERIRRQRRLIDFDDMVCECRRLLSENGILREKWQSRFQHILIDEFQDINSAQMSGVELLKGEQCDLFAVGDDDQSIYGFRGSEPECMKYFLKKYSAKQIILDINYRSTGEIVDASHKVIAENRKRFIKELKAFTREKGNPVFIKGFKDRAEELNYLVNQLLTYSKPGNNPSEDSSLAPDTLAVLFRTNILMQVFAAELSAKGIPFCMKERHTDIYEHEIVKDIWAYLELSQNPENRECLLRILNRPIRYINREAVMAKGVNVWDSMKGYYLRQNNIPYREARIKAVDKLKKDIEYIGSLSPYLAVKYVFKGTGYGKFADSRNYSSVNPSIKDIKQEKKEIIEWICEEARKYKNFEEWRIERENYSESFDKKDNCKTKQEGIIRLMTVHASKGLEFDRVWIPDCNENIFPYGKLPDTDTCEEERRIFYVAMTRAKKSLELLYLAGTKEHPRLPSRFLNPLFKPDL